MKIQWGKYFVCYLQSVLLGVAIVGYIFLRQGSFSLFLSNRVFASLSVIYLCFLLLLGPFSRLYDRFDSLLKYRKQLGIISFVYAVIHVIISFFLLPEQFPMNVYITTRLVPFTFGMIGFVTFVVLAILSIDSFIARLNRRDWWKFQNWGVRLATVGIVAHVLVIRYEGWWRWLSGGGDTRAKIKYLPSASLLFFIFTVYVLFVRIIDATNARFAKGLVQLVSVLFSVATVLLFIVGLLHYS